jgi:hypothetical protein
MRAEGPRSVTRLATRRHPDSLAHRCEVHRGAEDWVAGHVQLTISVPTIPFWAWPGTGQMYW